MRFLIALLAGLLVVLPSVTFGESWQEFLNKKKGDEAKGGVINKGARKVISKDLIVRQIKEQGQAVFESNSITFDYGSWQLRGGTEEQIAEIAAAVADTELKEVPYFYVDGHTCSVGTNENNCRLSNLRAQSVIDLLISRAGIPAGKLKARGFGENVPTHSNDSEESRQLNRRVVLKSGYDETSQDTTNRCSLVGSIQTPAPAAAGTTPAAAGTTPEQTGQEEGVQEKGSGAPKGWKKTYIPGGGSNSGAPGTTVHKGSAGSGKEEQDAPKGWKRIR
ncbi:MAG: OmpA family protein [Pseudomonadota bacterium]